MNWKERNVNPQGNRVGDCQTRALVTFLDITYPQATYLIGRSMGITGREFDTGSCLHHLLETMLGCEKNECKGTLATIAKRPETLKGAYVFMNNHAVCVKEGYYYDTWDSGRKRTTWYYTISDKNLRKVHQTLNYLDQFHIF